MKKTENNATNGEQEYLSYSTTNLTGGDWDSDTQLNDQTFMDFAHFFVII